MKLSLRRPVPLCCLLLLCSLIVTTESPANETMASDTDLMAMYFDDDVLVEVTTRSPKPISQVAENVTIVTAAEIEMLNLHTLEEVLKTVTGMFIPFSSPDFGGMGWLSSQGSKDWHVLVLIDGVRYNLASGGQAITNGIPLEIIDRIEVIRGPASSTWGSSLGGVVNIITKRAGSSTDRPEASLAAAMGEGGIKEGNLDLAGKANRLRYYLYGGAQESDGLLNERYFDNTRGYGKLNIDLTPRVDLTLSLGYSDPHLKTGDFPTFMGGIEEHISNRTTFGAANLDYSLSETMNLHLAVQTMRNDYNQRRNILSTTDLHHEIAYQEETIGVVSRLNWRQASHDTIVGIEYSRSKLDYTLNYGAPWGGPASLVAPEAAEERWGAFANSTMVLGALTVTPGLRVDYHSISGSFVSPSLGATYSLNRDTLLRAAVARGFSAPFLALISGGTLWEPVNPDLDPEIIWSYQAGLETMALAPLRCRVTLFHHKVEDRLVEDYPWRNGGEVARNGLELAVSTAAWRNLSMAADFTFVRRDEEDGTDDNSYSANLKFNFDHQASGFAAQLRGHFIWYDESMTVDAPNYGRFIWDLSARQHLITRGTNRAELFGAVHNLFDGAQYWDIDYQNPDRWVEAGVKIYF